MSRRRGPKGRGQALALGFGFTIALAITGTAQAQARQAGDPNVQAYEPGFFTQFHPASALAMVNNVPGFIFDGGSTNRGYAGNAGNVLIDGRRPPEDLQAVLDRMPVSAVKRIDLIRGGTPGIDMHGKAVVLNIIRQRQVSTTGNVNATFNDDAHGDFNPRGAFQIRHQNGDRTLDASLNMVSSTGTSDGEVERLDPMGGVIKRGIDRGNSSDYRYEASGAAETPFARGQLRANLHLTTEIYRFDSRETLVIPGGSEFSGNDAIHNAVEGGLRYSRTLANGAAWEVVGLEQYDIHPMSSFYDPAAFTSANRSGSHNGQSVLSSTLTLRAHGHWTFEGGAEVAYNWTDSDDTNILNGQPFILAGDHVQVQETRSESFFTATWRPRPSLTVESGLRYEMSNISAAGTAGSADQSLSYLKPRLNISWTPNTANEFGFRIERTVDQLSFGAFGSNASFTTGVSSIGNPRLRPANRWTIAARYQRRFAGRGSFLVELSHQESNDLNSSITVTAIDPQTGQHSRVDVARNAGPSSDFVLAVSAALPLDRFGLRGWTLTTHDQWTQSRFKDPVTLIDRRLSNELPAYWTAGLARSLPSSKLSWSVSLIGSYTSVAYSPRNISFSHTDYSLGVDVAYQATTALQLTAGLANLGAGGLDNGYTQFTDSRDVGAPYYSEATRTRGFRQAYVGFRKTF